MKQYFLTTDETAALNVAGHNPEPMQVLRAGNLIAVEVHPDNGYYDDAGEFVTSLPKELEQ